MKLLLIIIVILLLCGGFGLGYVGPYPAGGIGLVLVVLLVLAILGRI